MATLIIDNKDEFNMAVWNNKSDYMNEELYNGWIHGVATDALSSIYDNIEDSDEKAILGDVINMLSAINVEAKDEYKHDDLVQFIKDNCHLKSWQIEQAWDYIGNKYPIPHEVSDKIDVAITEFCIENDIDNDLVLSWEDNDDLFMECFSNNE